MIFNLTESNYTVCTNSPARVVSLDVDEDPRNKSKKK